MTQSQWAHPFTPFCWAVPYLPLLWYIAIIIKIWSFNKTDNPWQWISRLNFKSRISLHFLCRVVWLAPLCAPCFSCDCWYGSSWFFLTMENLWWQIYSYYDFMMLIFHVYINVIMFLRWNCIERTVEGCLALLVTVEIFFFETIQQGAIYRWSNSSCQRRKCCK